MPDALSAYAVSWRYTVPISPTYPGVYVEEIPSGVRTITGVSTAVAAFIGAAKRGPINKARHLFSFADFERAFGGLDTNSEMSYAIRQFYDFPGHSETFGGLVPRHVLGGEPKERCERPGSAKGAGVGQLQDCLDLAAQVRSSDGAAGPRPAEWNGRGR